MRSYFLSLWVVVVISFLNSTLRGNDLYIGRANIDITPELPIALMGQFHLRLAQEVETPLLATAIALETKGSTSEDSDTVIFVSCDLIWVSNLIIQQVRQSVAQQLPGFPEEKIVLSATHTHTAPVLEDESDIGAYFYYDIPTEGVVQVAEYRQFLVAQLTTLVINAWTHRVKGKYSWGLRRAAIPYNRRVVYKDGSAAMYGNMQTPDFEEIEGYEDHDVQSLFFWNEQDELLAMAINVACPAQEHGNRNSIDADYWHGVRKQLKEKYGSSVVVAGWIGAAGDQAPHPIYRKSALARMEELSGLSRMQDIAERIVSAVVQTYDIVKDHTEDRPLLIHERKILSLPKRIITTAEYIEAKQTVQHLKGLIQQDPELSQRHFVRMTWNQAILDRFEEQKTLPSPHFNTEVHVIRLGEVAIVTNQFELFTDFGIQMQARSPAIQTFVIQLAGPGSYLPTREAVHGGGYSAVCQSNLTNPEGGLLLVENTLEWVNNLWK